MIELDRDTAALARLRRTSDRAGIHNILVIHLRPRHERQPPPDLLLVLRVDVLCVADVRRCYEREGLTRDPGLAGTLDVTVTVLATGVVRRARLFYLRDLRGKAARVRDEKDR